MCGEIGFGVGVSAGVDVGGDLDSTGTELVVELAYGNPFLEVGVQVGLDSTGCLKLTPKGQVGPITFEPGKRGLDLEVEGSDALKIGAGAEAKIAAKACYQGKW